MNYSISTQSKKKDNKDDYTKLTSETLFQYGEQLEPNSLMTFQF